MFIFLNTNWNIEYKMETIVVNIYYLDQTSILFEINEDPDF